MKFFVKGKVAWRWMATFHNVSSILEIIGEKMRQGFFHLFSAAFVTRKVFTN
jgi:hypothetical protein